MMICKKLNTRIHVITIVVQVFTLSATACRIVHHLSLMTVVFLRSWSQISLFKVGRARIRVPLPSTETSRASLARIRIFAVRSTLGATLFPAVIACCARFDHVGPPSTLAYLISSSCAVSVATRILATRFDRTTTLLAVARSGVLSSSGALRMYRVTSC